MKGAGKQNRKIIFVVKEILKKLKKIQTLLISSKNI